MPWNKEKCQWGYPEGFTDDDARVAVLNADFTKAVFVQISLKEQTTKKAYTYHEFKGYRICIVGDVHRAESGPWNIAGNSFIPGWEDWYMRTPLDQVAVIGELSQGGSFPNENRYPHPV